MARIREIVIDARQPAALARFWAAALDGYAVRPYGAAELARLAARGRTPESDPSVALDGPGPTLFFQERSTGKAGRRRLHLDLVGGAREDEVERLCALGATLRSEHAGYSVLCDPEGNEFCVQDPKPSPAGRIEPPDALVLRAGTPADLPLLAKLNRQLVEDQRSSNPMSVAELEERMRGWLGAEYRALLFELAAEPVAYAVFRPTEGGIHLRQFFVVRHLRRQGIGRRAIEAFRKRHVPAGAALTLDVLVHNATGLAFWRALGFRERALGLWLPPSDARA